MDAGLVRVCASAWLVCSAASLSAADGPAASPAPATGWGEFTLVSVLGNGAFRHDNTVTKGMILSGGKRMLTSANDGTARLWDLQTGRQLQCYRHAKEYVWDFLVLPGEAKLLTAGGEDKVILWDLETAQRLAEYPHGKMTFRMALDPGGTRLAAGDQSGNCVVWDLAAKSQLARFGPGGGTCVYTVLFGPGGNSVLAGCEDSTIRSLSLDSNQERLLKKKDRASNTDERLGKVGEKLGKVAEMLGGLADTADIHTLAASPDGSRIVVCCSKRGPWLMDAATGRELWKAKDAPSAYCAAWSPDGNAVAVSGGKRLWVLDPNTGAKRWSAELVGDTHYGVAWSEGGNEILCGSNNLLCRFAARGASAGRRVYPPEGAPLQQDAVRAALPSPDGELIYESGSSAGIRVWDRRRRQVKATWLEKEEIRGLALSADGLTLAAGAGKIVVALDTRTGKEIHRYGRDSEYGDLALTPDGQMIVLSGAPGLAVLRVATGAKVADLSGDSGYYYSTSGLAVSQDMELAVATGEHVRLFKLPGGELLQELGRGRREGRGNIFAPPLVPGDDGAPGAEEEPERFSGCAFVAGATSCLVTLSNKRVQMWAPAQAEANALTAAEAAALVEQLNADSFQLREAATKRLSAAGRAVLPLLRAVETKDAELSARLELVQKEILGSGKLRPAGSVDLKDGGATSFALHPDGRHWALAHGDVPSRTILIGEVAGRDLRTLRSLQPASAPSTSAGSTGTSAANVVVFDKSGALIVGNCNGTISEYRLKSPSPPATAPAKEPAK